MSIRAYGSILICALLLVGCAESRKLMPTPNLYTDESATLFDALPEEYASTRVELIYVTDRGPEMLPSMKPCVHAATVAVTFRTSLPDVSGSVQGPFQSKGMCFAELTVQEKSKPNASTLHTVDLPHVTNCGPGPVSEPGALANRGYSPGLLVGPVSASAQALTLPAMSTPQRDWLGVIT